MPPRPFPSRFAAAALAAVLLAGPPGARATVIDATLVPLGGAAYRWNYILTNDGSLGAGVALASFDLAFLTATVTAWSELGGGVADWDEYALPTFGDDLFGADATPGGGIAVGGSATFSVDFTWSGAGTPGAQVYTVYDPDSFATLETGWTAVAAIAQPPTANLLGLPLAVLLARSLARRARRPRPA